MVAYELSASEVGSRRGAGQWAVGAHASLSLYMLTWAFIHGGGQRRHAFSAAYVVDDACGLQIPNLARLK